MRRVKPEEIAKRRIMNISAQSAGPVTGRSLSLGAQAGVSIGMAPELVRKATRGRENSHQKIKLGAIFNIEHWRGNSLLREFQEENLCPDEFINYVLDVALSDATQYTDWYVLIFNDNHTPAAGDTYATPGFTESTDYDETTRPAWVEAGVSSKVITNSASKATFTMAGTDTSIYGAAIVGGVHATDGDIDTKGNTAASPGVLGPEAQFTGGAVTGIVDDDVLKVYVTITGSDV